GGPRQGAYAPLPRRGTGPAAHLPPERGPRCLGRPGAPHRGAHQVTPAPIARSLGHATTSPEPVSPAGPVVGLWGSGLARARPCARHTRPLRCRHRAEAARWGAGDPPSERPCEDDRAPEGRPAARHLAGLLPGRHTAEPRSVCERATSRRGGGLL